MRVPNAEVTDRQSIAVQRDFCTCAAYPCTSAIIIRLDFKLLLAHVTQTIMALKICATSFQRESAQESASATCIKVATREIGVAIIAYRSDWKCSDRGHSLWHVGASCLVSFEVILNRSFSKHEGNSRFAGCRSILPFLVSKRPMIQFATIGDSKRREMIKLDDFYFNPDWIIWNASLLNLNLARMNYYFMSYIISLSVFSSSTFEKSLRVFLQIINRSEVKLILIKFFYALWYTKD